jgi:hypothetical protein
MRTADRLALAASPVFAFMALIAAQGDDAGNVLCGAASGSPWSGMVAMYALMSVAHLPPWVRLLARRRATRVPGDPPSETRPLAQDAPTS